MDQSFKDVSIIKTLEEIYNDRYKYERFVKYILEFNDSWRELKSSNDGSQAEGKLWGSEIRVNPKFTINDVLDNPLYSNIIEFFNLRDLKYIGQIRENDLIELIYHENIGAKKYLGFLDILFVQGSNIESYESDLEAEIEGEDIMKKSIIQIYNDLKLADEKELFMNATDDFNLSDENNNIKDGNTKQNDLYQVEEIVSDVDLRRILDESINTIIDNYGMAVRNIESLKSENSKLVKEVSILDNRLNDNHNKYREQINKYEIALRELKDLYTVEKENYKNKVDDLDLSLKSIKKEKIFLEVQLENHEEQLSRIQSELSDVNMLLKDKEKTIEFRNQDIEYKNIEIEDKTKLITSLKEELDDLTRLKEKESTNFKNEIIKLKAEIEDNKKTITELSSLKGIVDSILKRFKSIDNIDK